MTAPGQIRMTGVLCSTRTMHLIGSKPQLIINLIIVIIIMLAALPCHLATAQALCDRKARSGLHSYVLHTSHTKPAIPYASTKHNSTDREPLNAGEGSRPALHSFRAGSSSATARCTTHRRWLSACGMVARCLVRRWTRCGTRNVCYTCLGSMLRLCVSGALCVSLCVSVSVLVGCCALSVLVVLCMLALNSLSAVAWVGCWLVRGKVQL